MTWPWPRWETDPTSCTRRPSAAKTDAKGSRMARWRQRAGRQERETAALYPAARDPRVLRGPGWWPSAWRAMP